MAFLPHNQEMMRCKLSKRHGDFREVRVRRHCWAGFGKACLDHQIRVSRAPDYQVNTWTLHDSKYNEVGYSIQHQGVMMS